MEQEPREPNKPTVEQLSDAELGSLIEGLYERFDELTEAMTEAFMEKGRREERGGL